MYSWSGGVFCHMTYWCFVHTVSKVHVLLYNVFSSMYSGVFKYVCTVYMEYLGIGYLFTISVQLLVLQVFVFTLLLCVLLRIAHSDCLTWRACRDVHAATWRARHHDVRTSANRCCLDLFARTDLESFQAGRRVSSKPGKHTHTRLPTLCLLLTSSLSLSRVFAYVIMYP